MNPKWLYGKKSIGSREGVYNLRTIIERYVKCGKNIYLSFIDYEKAFDRVKHERRLLNAWKT